MTFIRLVPIAVLALATSLALAQTAATGVITETGFSNNVYSYDIQLNNTGSTGIETFWFAWVPGANFMPDSPSAISQPSGWTDTVTSGGGFAIQWKTSTALASGSSLDGFHFSSTDSLSTLEGTSQGNPILTSFVYSGQPFSGTSDQFVVSAAAAPEPSSWLALGGFAIAAIVAGRRRFAFSR